MRLLTFQLSNEIFGIDIIQVCEILGFQRITRVPRTKAEQCGVINLRGSVISVLDMRYKLGVPISKPTKNSCIIIVEFIQSDGPLILGILVDQVREVCDVIDDRIDPPPRTHFKGAKYLRGLGRFQNDYVMILDSYAIFGLQEEKPDLVSASLAPLPEQQLSGTPLQAAPRPTVKLPTKKPQPPSDIDWGEESEINQEPPEASEPSPSPDPLPASEPSPSPDSFAMDGPRVDDVVPELEEPEPEVEGSVEVVDNSVETDAVLEGERDINTDIDQALEEGSDSASSEDDNNQPALENEAETSIEEGGVCAPVESETTEEGGLDQRSLVEESGLIPDEAGEELDAVEGVPDLASQISDVDQKNPEEKMTPKQKTVSMVVNVVTVKKGDKTHKIIEKSGKIATAEIRIEKQMIDQELELEEGGLAALAEVFSFEGVEEEEEVAEAFPPVSSDTESSASSDRVKKKSGPSRNRSDKHPDNKHFAVKSDKDLGGAEDTQLTNTDNKEVKTQDQLESEQESATVSEEVPQPIVSTHLENPLLQENIGGEVSISQITAEIDKMNNKTEKNSLKPLSLETEMEQSLLGDALASGSPKNIENTDFLNDSLVSQMVDELLPEKRLESAIYTAPKLSAKMKARLKQAKIADTTTQPKKEKKTTESKKTKSSQAKSSKKGKSKKGKKGKK
ncbi:MAG: chemotaxis protein CheW [Magnetococcales bacterium]|nr:chemotaxis protein CheW [Magnetococcales bacterium]